MCRTRPHLYWILSCLFATLAGCVTTDPSLLTTRAEQARMAYDPGMKVMQSGSGRGGGASSGSRGGFTSPRGGASIGRSTSAVDRGPATAALAANWSRNWNGNRAAGVASGYFPMNGAAEPNAAPTQTLTAGRGPYRRSNPGRRSIESFDSQAEILASNRSARPGSPARRVDAELTLASSDPTKDENPRGSSTFLPVAIDLPARSESSPIDRQIARAGAEVEQFPGPGTIVSPVAQSNGPVVPFGERKPSGSVLTSSSLPNSAAADEERIAQTGSAAAASPTRQDDFIQPLPIVPFRAPEPAKTENASTSLKQKQSNNSAINNQLHASPTRNDANSASDRSAAASDRRTLESTRDRSLISKFDTVNDPRREERDRALRDVQNAQNKNLAPRASTNVDPMKPAQASALNRREIPLEYVKDGIDDPTLWGRPRLARLNNNPRAVGLYVERPTPPFPRTYYPEVKRTAAEERSVTTETAANSTRSRQTGVVQTGLPRTGLNPTAPTRTGLNRSANDPAESTDTAAKQSTERKQSRLVAAIASFHPFQKSTRDNTLEQTRPNASVEGTDRSIGRRFGKAITDMKNNAWNLVSGKKELDDKNAIENRLNQNVSLRVASAAPVVPGGSAPIVASRSNPIAGGKPGSTVASNPSKDSHPNVSPDSNEYLPLEGGADEPRLSSKGRGNGSSDRRVRLTGAAVESNRSQANTADSSYRGLRSPKAPDPSIPAASPAQPTSAAVNPNASVNSNRSVVASSTQKSINVSKRPFFTNRFKAADAISTKANGAEAAKPIVKSDNSIDAKADKANDAKSEPGTNLRPVSKKRFRLFGSLRDSIDKRFGAKKSTNIES